MTKKNVIAPMELNTEFGDARLVAHYENLDDDGEIDDMERIHNMLGKTSGAIKVSLYRTNTDNRKLTYVCPLDAANFGLEEIRLKAGGGDFVVRAYDERGKLCVNEHLSIEGAPIIQSAQIAPAREPSSGGADINAIAAMMRENSRAVLEGMAQILLPHLNQQATPSRMDLLAEIAAMKNLFSSPVQAPATSAASGVDLIMKGIELAKSIQPREGEVGGMEVLQDAIRSFAPVVQDIIKNQTAQNPPVSRPQLSKPQNPIATVQLPKEGADMDIMFKYYLGQLVKFAGEGRDVSLYAELVADNVLEEKLLALLAKPDPVAELGIINPGVLTNRVWFEALIIELREMFGLTDQKADDTVAENIPGEIPATDVLTDGDK